MPVTVSKVLEVNDKGEQIYTASARITYPSGTSFSEVVFESVGDNPDKIVSDVIAKLSDLSSDSALAVNVMTNF